MIETKRSSTILNVVLTLIILVIGFLFWPGKEKFNQSNPRDVNKTQIKIKVKALNIRKEATVDSKDIGTVYLGEIFTVLEHIDKEDYYWYKIKTKQGTTGYLASDRNNEYIEVISGLVDREPPVITSKSTVLKFLDGEPNYDDIECVDNHSECKLEYDNSNPGTVVIKGTDEAGNETVFEIKYYDVYSLNTLFSENVNDLNVTIAKKVKDNNYIINANYITNKEILNENMSKSYNSIIDYFDEDFNKIEGMHTSINKQHLGGMCINDESNNLDSEYDNISIPKGSALCMNYTFTNKDNNIKYIAIGFQSMDNYDNVENPYAEYYSKYFELD